MIGQHTIGSIARLALDIIQNGVGIVSETPTVAIQRLADGRWFQASDGTWKLTKVENPMVEADSANCPGRYQFDFDQSLDDVTGSFEYLAKLTNTGGFPVLEYQSLVFGLVPAVTAPGLCSVQGTIFTAQGKPLDNVLVRATLVPVFTDELSRGIEADTVVQTYTDSQGFFDISLVRGGTFRLEIDAIGFDRRVLIPDQATAQFTDL